MGKRITWAPKGAKPKTTYTGRNGVGTCIGVDVFCMGESQDAWKRVMLTAINSKGDLARCDMDLPGDPITLRIFASAILDAADEIERNA